VDAGEAPAEMLGDPSLMRRVQVGEEQADRDRLRAACLDRPRQPLGLLVSKLLDHPIRAGPLGRLEAQLGLDQRRRLRRAQPVEVRPVLAADLQQVGEAAGRHQRRPRPAFLEQGVGADRHPVGERLDVSSRAFGSPQHGLDRLHHPRRLLAWSGGDLRRVDGAAVEQDGIGEGAADVDPEQHQSQRSCRAVPSAETTTWMPSRAGSGPGRSVRRWPPRDSARSRAEVARARASG